jgi:hypothetical protein
LLTRAVLYQSYMFWLSRMANADFICPSDYGNSLPYSALASATSTCAQKR